MLQIRRVGRQQQRQRQYHCQARLHSRVARPVHCFGCVRRLTACTLLPLPAPRYSGCCKLACSEEVPEPLDLGGEGELLLLLCSVPCCTWSCCCLEHAALHVFMRLVRRLAVADCCCL